MSFMLSPITGQFLVTPTGFAVHRRCCNQILMNSGSAGFYRLPPSILPVCWARPAGGPPGETFWGLGHYGNKVWTNADTGSGAGSNVRLIDVDTGIILASHKWLPSTGNYSGYAMSCPSDDTSDFCFAAGYMTSPHDDVKKLRYTGGSIVSDWSWNSTAAWLLGVTCRPAGDKVLVTGYRGRAWSLPNSDYASVWEINDADQAVNWSYDMSDRGTDCMYHSDYYYVTSRGNGTPDNVTLWQFSLTGSVNWSKKFSNQITGLWADSDGVRIVCNRTNDWPGAAGEYASVWKLDHSGSVVWSYDASDTGNHRNITGVCTANGETRASYDSPVKSFVILDDTDGTLIDSDNTVSGVRLCPVGHRR